MAGWTASYRQIWDHPLFKGNALRVGVWQWMIHRAVWRPTKFNRDGDIITLRRGELCVSQNQIVEATGMSRQQLRTFLAELEKEGALQPQVNHKSTKGKKVFFIAKYDTYQSSENSSNQAATKQQPIKEQGNTSVSKDTGNFVADPVKVMFDSGVALMMASGISEKNARSNIGKWRKVHGVEAVITAIGAAKREGSPDPIAFINGIWRQKQRTNGTAKASGQASHVFMRKAKKPAAREREPC